MEHYMISNRPICFLATWMPVCHKIKQKVFVMAKHFSYRVRQIDFIISESMFFTVLEIRGICIGWEADWDTANFYERLICELFGNTFVE